MQIGSPYERAGQWFYKPEGGQERGPYRDERTARACRTRELRSAHRAAAAARDRPADVPEYDDTLGWWLSRMAEKAIEVIRGGGAEPRADLKALAQAAQAAQKLYDQSDLERQVEELKSFRREMELERAHAARTTRRDPRPQEVDEPGGAVRRHGDPPGRVRSD